MPRGAAVRQRMQALSGMIGRKASVGGFSSPPSNPRAQPWTGGGNYQAGYGRGRGNFRWSGEMCRDRKEHQRRKHSAGPTLTLRDESWGANGIRYPSSPSRKRWILGAVRIDPCSAVANALSIPPGDERTLPGLDMPRILLKRGVPSGTRTQVVHGCRQLVPCHHWVWNPEQTAGDKPEEGEDDVKSSCPLCPGRHTCYNGRDKGRDPARAATRLHEAGIASNRRSAIRR
ncbi:hypothetical protein H6P81_021277 [Aristolochia fimbriata]|uniref:Uncharacterized protein n=1 Tax=Aristolochia fimbriata TaxID=158543 RepID=A0AAV7DTK0_ARIFI|nr:hypothetical protein H6P81_021277 [Aristolochia fimbriata]